jgi:hypothetical protein
MDFHEHLDEVEDLREKLRRAEARIEELNALINTPEILDFMKAVPLEAAHQRERWGSDHDAGKTDSEWLWLIGFLACKALFNPGMPATGADEICYHIHKDKVTGEPLYFTRYTCPEPTCPERDSATPLEKQLHRIVTIAAAAANWHSAKLGKTNMRPGILPPEDKR